MAPIDIFIRSLFYPVVDYALKYDGDKTVNEAKGELYKPNQSRWPDSLYIGRQFVGSGRDDKGSFDTGAIYIGRGWFKLISKVYE